MTDAAAACQFDIARQQHSSLRTCATCQVMVIGVRNENRIVAQQTQPCRQTPQHRIGDEFHPQNYTTNCELGMAML